MVGHTANDARALETTLLGRSYRWLAVAIAVVVAAALAVAMPFDTDAGAVTTAATTTPSTISTVAGAVCAPSPATGVGLSPATVVSDGAGGYYVADSTHSVVCRVDGAGNIAVIAGNGAMGPWGDGGPATSAELYMPSGLAVGPGGSLYIADRSNQRIRRVDGSTGVISTVAGTGQAGYADGLASSAVLNYPAGLAIAGTHLYIADSKNNRVRQLDLVSGVVTTLAGTGAAGATGDGGPAVLATLSFPTGVAVDGDGSVLVADTNNSRIRRVDLTGVISTVAGSSAGFSGDGSLATAARLNHPMSVATAPDGIYIADSANNRIRRIDRAGVITTLAGNGAAAFAGDGGSAPVASLYYPMGVAVTTSGVVVVGDSGNLRVRRVTPDGLISTSAGNGTYGFSGDGGAASSAELNEPIGVSTAPDGSVLIADSLDHVIRKVSTSGVITTVAGVAGSAGFGGDGGPAVSARLQFPTAVVADSHGNLFIADQGNNRIRRVTVDGTITTVAGVGVAGFGGDGGAATHALLDHPSALALGKDGSVFVADTANNRVRRFRIGGTISSVAGNGMAGYGGDGGMATKASLDHPSGLAIGSNVLFVADTNNQRVRTVNLKTMAIRTLTGTGQVGYSGDGTAASSSLFNYPTGVALGTTGNLYVADKGNCVVRQVTGVFGSSPTVSTVVGWPPVRSITPVCGFAGEGTPPTSGGTMLYNPTGVAVAPGASLLIADSLTNRVRRVTGLG